MYGTSSAGSRPSAPAGSEMMLGLAPFLRRMNDAIDLLKPRAPPAKFFLASASCEGDWRLERHRLPVSDPRGSSHSVTHPSASRTLPATCRRHVPAASAWRVGADEWKAWAPPKATMSTDDRMLPNCIRVQDAEFSEPAITRFSGACGDTTTHDTVRANWLAVRH